MPAHAHHAIQIVIALDGCVAISGSDGEWHETRGLVMRPDAEHSFDCNGAFGVMVDQLANIVAKSAFVIANLPYRFDTNSPVFAT